MPAIGSMRFLPNQEFVGTAKSITVKNNGKYWKIIFLAEYEDKETLDLTDAEIKNAIGVDLGLPLRLIPAIKRTISSLLKRLKSLKMRFQYLSAA